MCVGGVFLCGGGGVLGRYATVVLGWVEIGKGVRRASKGFWVSASRL